MSQPYQRRHPNWIQGFLDWTLDRSQISEQLILWSGIWTIAATLRRRIAITRTSGFLGSWDCYPYLYVMVVGPAGIGKTTAVRYAFDLLDQVPAVGKPPTFATVEGLIDTMIKSDDSSATLVVEEFGDIMLKDASTRMYQFLTSAYDGKANIRQNTLSRQMEFADKPVVNMFAGTTPEWIATDLPKNTLNGGFGSRCIWLYIASLRRRRMFYEQEMKATDFIAIEKKLVADLNHIATLEGEYTIAKEARIFLELWYEELPTKISKKLTGYAVRKHAFVLKLAMILHVAYSDSKEISFLDVKEAIKLLDGLEKDMPRIFEGVGRNVHGLDVRDMVEYIKGNPGTPEMELRSVFQEVAGPGKLTELIEGLLMAGLARTEIDKGGKRLFYEVIKSNGKI